LPPLSSAQRPNIEVNACRNQETANAEELVASLESSMTTPLSVALRVRQHAAFPVRLFVLTPKPPTSARTLKAAVKRLGRRTPRRNSKYEKRATARISLNL
jgi:hypothetical protein